MCAPVRAIAAHVIRGMRPMRIPVEFATITASREAVARLKCITSSKARNKRANHGFQSCGGQARDAVPHSHDDYACFADSGPGLPGPDDCSHAVAAGQPVGILKKRDFHFFSAAEGSRKNVCAAMDAAAPAEAGYRFVGLFSLTEVMLLLPSSFQTAFPHALKSCPMTRPMSADCVTRL